MSTRCNIRFIRYGKVTANIYVHCDGYPNSDAGMLANLQRFFEAVEAQAGDDTRYDDPEYLAARFVVWQAGRMAEYGKGGGPLDFIGVGVNIRDQGDIDYVYQVHCDTNLDDKGRPIVTYYHITEREGKR